MQKSLVLTSNQWKMVLIKYKKSGFDVEKGNF